MRHGRYLVVLEDVPEILGWIREVASKIASRESVEVVSFLRDIEAARFVEIHRDEIIGYIQDWSRDDPTDSEAWGGDAGLQFIYRVISPLTPNARVVISSGAIDVLDDLPKLPLPLSSLRTAPKPLDYRDLEACVEWLIADLPDRQLDSIGETLQISFLPYWERLCADAATRPELLDKLAPRQFEELIAELFRDQGWEVELTARTRDGGYDIIGVKRVFPTSFRVLVEAKRYRPDKPVKVGIVRSLYGLKHLHTVNQVILATTSWISRYAKAEFAQVIPWELDFLERSKILDWCSRYCDIPRFGTLERQSHRAPNPGAAPDGKGRR
jgi:hypothetical protein